MNKPRHQGVEEARKQLPALVEQAASGAVTVITRHGRPMAALVPLDRYGGSGQPQSLLPLAGSGRGLWGRNSAASIRKLRDEWSR